jgi:catechol 2,3-dioxygenase-like lactoylglutathione lyase family enzyme
VSDIGRQPPLIPEFKVSNIDVSVRFYTDTLGFRVVYNRPEEKFAYLEREGAEMMLEQADELADVTAPLELPFGRGMHLQIQVSEVEPLYATCVASGAVHRELYEKWYRAHDLLLGNRQFWVSDPDGYLLRFFQDLGERPA